MKNSADMHHSLQHWLEQRAPQWQTLARLIAVMKGKAAHKADSVRDVVGGYRRIARDLSMARRVVPNTRISRSLEVLYQDAHDVLHRPPGAFLPPIIQLYTQEVPAAMRQLAPYLLWVTVLFLLSGLAGWLLISTYPELAGLIASESMINTVQRGELWTDGLLNIAPSSILSLDIFANNITVSIVAFSVGVFYGLGTLYIIGLNGFMVGGIFAFTAKYDLAGRLFEFVVAHGITELSIICVAGALGMRLGEALVRPGEKTRSEAFSEAASQASKLFAVIGPFLFGCAIIEGYISPDPYYPLISRLIMGLSFFIIFVLALNGRLWNTRARRLMP